MKQTILLIDSDAQILEQLRSVLRRENYKVLIAAHGNAALRLAQTAHPNLIVSELMLPGMDGYQVWHELRQQEATAQIPILVMSALSVPAPNQLWRATADSEWYHISYDAFLPKPLDLRQFMQVIKQLLHPNTSSGGMVADNSIIVAIEADPLRQQVTDMLQAANFTVTASASLQQAEQWLQVLPPAALLLDYQQPKEQINRFITRTQRFLPQTTIFLIGEPTLIWQALPDYKDGVLRPPLEQEYTISKIRQVLQLNELGQRNNILSHRLIATMHELIEMQETLQAQNQELQYVNQQLKEMDDLKEMFTGMVVHDLKAPLSAMLGTLSFVQIDPSINLTDKTKQLVTGGYAAGEQMLRLVETLLEGQRLEAGRIQPEQEPLEVEELIYGTLEHMASLLALHHVEAETRVAEGLPTIFIDPQMGQRVLENLLDNAIKYSPREGTIIIKAAPLDDAVSISVQDQGPGIPPEKQKDIFDRFVQLKNKEKGSDRGNFGLGLNFCQLATESMGGEIWVESDGQLGTKFVFTVPIYNEEDFKEFEEN